MPKTNGRKTTQTNVRIDLKDKALLDQLSIETGESTPKLLHRAVNQLRRKIFFEKMNRVSREIQEDPELWAAQLAEQKLLDNTSGDGLKGLD